MKPSTQLASLLSLVLVLSSAAADLEPWINEFHYDNPGTDSGEFVEVAVPAGFTTLESVRLALYNGGDGTTYGAVHPLSTFTQGSTLGDITFYSKFISGLQNGAADGMSLDLDGMVTHFISYEGSFTASAGPASGLTSLDVLFSEGDVASPGAALGLVGVGSRGNDFVWQPLAEASPGALNGGQMIVPEPRPGVLVAMMGLGLWTLQRLRRISHADY